MMNILMGVAPAPAEEDLQDILEEDASDKKKVETPQDPRAVAPMLGKPSVNLSLSMPSSSQVTAASVNPSSGSPSSNRVSAAKLPSPSSPRLESSSLRHPAESRSIRSGVSDEMELEQWESDPIQDWPMEETSILVQDEGISHVLYYL